MRIRPTTHQSLVDELADQIAARQPGARLPVAVDGPAPAHPDRLATALVDPLRVRGRPTLLIPATGFWRPASLRLERGHTNPDAFYEQWLDHAALRREVLDRLDETSDGRILPDLRNPATDRPTRSPYVTIPPDTVVLIHGALLLGRGLPFQFTIHLDLSPAALARRTPTDQQWTLPAFTRYTRQAQPWRHADIVIRCDDPARPAVVDAT